MRNLFTTGIMNIFLVSAVSLSHADWQYTKWGMTVEEVRNASNGLAIDNPKIEGYSAPGLEDSKDLLKAPYKAGDFEFTSHFLFDNKTKKLNRVVLKVARSCNMIFNELKNKYGDPISKTLGTVRWNDRQNNNGIIYLDLSMQSSEYCQIQYFPLTTKTNEKL